MKARMFKKGMIVALLVSLIFAGGVWASPAITLIINGQRAKAEVRIINGVSFLPLREVAERLGTPVHWDGRTRTITVGPGEGARSAPIIPEDEIYRAGGLTFFGFQEWLPQFGVWSATLNIWNTDIVDYSRIDYTITLLDSRGMAVNIFEGTEESLLRGAISTILLQVPDALSGVVGFRVQINRAY